VSNKPCPEDDYWTKEYGVPVLAAMANSDSGVLQVYPEAWKQDRQTLIRNIIHEIGHTFSLRRLGYDLDAPAWKAWRDACASDAIAPSYYGAVSPYEDIAETFLLWFVSKGHPEFAEYQRMMPARFALMEKMLRS
jgi:hypothetical protein